MQLNQKAVLPIHLLATICLLIFADQASKAIVRMNLPPGGSISLINEALRITYTQNFRGFSWWVPALPAWTKVTFQFVLFLMVMVAVPIYIFYNHTCRHSIWADIGFVGVVASGSSHLVDDFLMPFATDFIQVFGSPCANFADIYSYIGIGAVAVETIWVFKTRKPRWKGIRHFLSARLQTWKEFVEFFRKGLGFSKGVK